MKKTLITVVLTAVVCFAVVGTTLAFLVDKTDPVVNTFTVGNVDITLTETTGATYKLIPGHVYTKDPTVTVKANSEDCWLFVELTPANDFDTYVTYAIADGWTQLSGSNVYYRAVSSSNADQPFAVLKDNTATVKSSITKTQLDNIQNDPTITFTAYAVQQDGLDVNQAWTEANNAANLPADTTTTTP